MEILPQVDKVIVETIRGNMSTVPKSAVFMRRSDSPPKKTPAVYVWNDGFVATDMTIGSEGPEAGEVVNDEFNGDGKRTSFRLSAPPLRSLLSLEYPRRKPRREGRDFTVDYKAGTVTLHEPPVQGNRNLLVRYSSGKEAGEVKGQKIALQYYVDIWTSDPEEESRIVNEVASILLKARESLTSAGVLVRLTHGNSLTAKDGIPPDLFCKRLECTAETSLLVKVPIPRIERIELKRVEETKA